MPRVVNPPSAIQEGVNRRFFAAVDALVAAGAIRSLSAKSNAKGKRPRLAQYTPPLLNLSRISQSKRNGLKHRLKSLPPWANTSKSIA